MDRIRCELLKDKVVSAKEASMHIKDGMFVGISGFTPAGYPKAVPLELAKRVDDGEKIQIDIISGASVGPEVDEELAKRGIIRRRYPYQTNSTMRNEINAGKIKYDDMHLSHSAQYMSYGFLGQIDIAIVEAIAITENGGIVPTTSVGNSATIVKLAKKVIVEVNTAQPMSLEGIHDIYMLDNPPHRKAIPLEKSSDVIGTTYIPCDIEKIVAIVYSDISDKTREVAEISENSQKMANNLINFLQQEVKSGRLPSNLLPLQSGVGSVANAVLAGLCESDFTNLDIYSEVLQDSVLDLIDAGKVRVASATSLTISPKKLEHFYSNFEKYKKYIVLRPQEISNNPEAIRRLGIIAMNTAIEVDIYGNVNSTHIMGSKIMNGIGGSGDFARNAYLSIFTTESIAKGGNISSIVPMVSHHDHTEHDVMVIVTEQGVADLRGLSPIERAECIIQNCAHPEYRQLLMDYLTRSINKKTGLQTPHILNEALSWHQRFIDGGTMKK